MISMRLKLTAWYLGILAAVLLAFGVGLYLYLSTALLKVVDSSLNEYVKTLEARLRAATMGEEAPEVFTGRLAIAPEFVELIGPSGEISDVAALSERRRVPINRRTLELAKTSNEPVSEDLLAADGQAMRVVTWRILDANGQIDGFIRAGYVIEDAYRAKRRLLLILILAIPIALVLASYGGKVLADKALKPVDRITQAAQTISARNLKERVETPRTNDELARLAETFNQMIARLDEAFERERRFTDDASHELRTPLTVLRSDIEVTLRRERAPEEYRRVLESCLEEIIRLNKLVDDLLTLSRSDTGRLTLELAPLRLDQLCREVCDYVSPLVEQRGLQLRVLVPEEPIVITGDAKRLKQLLLNLLDNAIKFTASGGSITLSATKKNSVAVVDVADTGCGISAEDLPHIFDRFYRRRKKITAQASGFGLGLAIAKWIVEAHGGKISALSEADKGSTFTFELPISKQSQEAKKPE